MPTAAGDPPAAAAQIAASGPASWSLCPLLGAGEGLARPWWPGAPPGFHPRFHGPPGPVMAARGGHGPAWRPLLPSGPLPCPAWPLAWCGCLGPLWPSPAALWPLPGCCCIPGRCPIWTQRPPAAGDPPAAAAQIAASFPALVASETDY